MLKYLFLCKKNRSEDIYIEEDHPLSFAQHFAARQELL